MPKESAESNTAAPGTTVDEVRAATGAPLAVAPALGSMA
jgi:acyl CoA:acetate/3-ketoacid CoA transferase beta subunit